MPLKRTYTGGRFALEMEANGQVNAGWLISVDGGMATSEVVQEKFGPDTLIHKHVSHPKYEDITVVVGPGMSQHFYDWIRSSFNSGGDVPADYKRISGAIIQADYNFVEKSRLSFYEGLASELTLPGGDAASSEKATVTVKFTPEWTRWERKDGPNILSSPRPIKADQAKNWLLRDFRLEIDDLDCTRVNKFEPITLRQKTVEVPLGEFRDPHREPVTVEYPNLSLMVPESHIDTFLDWYNDFVIKGNCDGKEKNGQLTYLSTKLDEICTLNLYGLGIFKLTPDKGEALSDKIRYVKVEMYCERMEIDDMDSWE